MTFEIPPYHTVRVLVVGDVMLDRYWHGPAHRMSPEAPIPIVHVQETEERPGGAANVALNLNALGCHVTLVGLIGNDSAGNTLEHQLHDAGIQCKLQRLPGFSTVTKLRVLGRNQQLIRLDFENVLDTLKTQNLTAQVKSLLSDIDIIVLSDYAKGTLHHAQGLILLAKKAGIPVIIDPKSKDFGLYRDATVITPNQKEFEAVVGQCLDSTELVAKGNGLMRDFNIRALLITQGEHGMTLLQQNAEPIYLPTRTREVYDVTGAGDTVISVLAATLATGRSLEASAFLANIAAGIVIRKLGATTVSIPELRRAMQRNQNSEFGILSEEELMLVVADARAHKEKIIMTNGCFDILHAGHVQYLQEAKELGQRLIVAVNDDDSVCRLKGSKRPINSLKQRMSVLSALRAVDWVVSFSEDTPERLIKQVSPDVLVKGGDYRATDIAGADYVVAQGGTVKIMPFKPGHSTTQLIEKIRDETIMV